MLFSVQLDLKGKTLSEKSKMMATAWRNMSGEEKQNYAEPTCQDADKLPITDKKRVIMKIAKQYQEKVGYLGMYTCT